MYLGIIGSVISTKAVPLLRPIIANSHPSYIEPQQSFPPVTLNVEVWKLIKE
jgi:hypothetical protein